MPQVTFFDVLNHAAAPAHEVVVMMPFATATGDQLKPGLPVAKIAARDQRRGFKAREATKDRGPIAGRTKAAMYFINRERPSCGGEPLDDGDPGRRRAKPTPPEQRRRICECFRDPVHDSQKSSGGHEKSMPPRSG